MSVAVCFREGVFYANYPFLIFICMCVSEYSSLCGFVFPQGVWAFLVVGM